MEKRKGRSLNAIYCRPLPIPISVDKHGQLPIPGGLNPLSWAYLVYRVASLYLQSPPREPKVSVRASADGKVFLVTDESDMTRLWQQGFFGKGTLSRSEPSWKSRMQRRRDAGSGEMAKEDFTKARRDERKRFKTLRGKAQAFEALSRSRVLTEAEQKEWDDLKVMMESVKAGGPEVEGKAKAESEPPKQSEKNTETTSEAEKQGGATRASVEVQQPVLAGAEADVQSQKSQLQNIESLQLQPTEVFFLNFALDAVSVTHEDRVLSAGELFRLCLGAPRPDSRFLLNYVVYHHFRSLGWCVRSGIKFGTDMLLYKRGPPFMHAEYALLIIPNTGAPWTTWEDFMATARVVTGVKKTLVLVYVDVPSAQEFAALGEAWDSGRIRRLLQLYKVTEVVYKRWSPSRTRD